MVKKTTFGMANLSGFKARRIRGRRILNLFTLKMSDDADVDSILNISKLTAMKAASEHVNLSLDKKGRWKTLETLKDDLYKGVLSGENFAVYVIERCWLNRQANCTELTTNTGTFGKDSGRKRSKLFNPELILKESKPKKSRGNGKHKCMGPPGPEEKEVTPPLSSLRVEVVQQYQGWGPTTAVTTRRQRQRQALSKHAENDRGTIADDDSTDVPSVTGVYADHPCTRRRMREPTKTSKKSKIIQSNCDVWNDHDSWCRQTLELDDNDLGEHTNAVDQEDKDYCTKQQITFGDYIIKNTNKCIVKKKLNCARHKTGKKTKKGNVFYVDKNEFSTSIIDQETAPELPPRNSRKGKGTNYKQCNIKCSALVSLDGHSACSLAGMFGNRYVECACFPRRFLLDMTSAIREAPHLLVASHTHIRYNRKRQNIKYYTHYHRIPQSVSLSGVLHFEEYTDGTFRVKLETDSSLDVSDWLQEVVTGSNWTVRSLADSLCDVIRKAPPSCTNVKGHARSNSHLTFPTLRNILDWPVTESSFPTTIIESENDIDKLKTVPSSEGSECCICYNTIDLKSRDLRGSVLSSCGHWCCNDCWNTHITTCITSGHVNVSCPEFGCKELLDTATIASFVRMREFKMFLSRKNDIEIQKSDSKVWCPAPGCGRIVVVKNNMKGSAITGGVTCACGASFCLKCKSHPHWPADCKDMAGYEADLKRFGDSNMVSFISNTGSALKGKRCPECKTFIEKHDGCPNIVCLCGHSFCWQCFMPWRTHQFNMQCYSKPDTYDTMEMAHVYLEELAMRPSSRTRSYMTALTSRQKQVSSLRSSGKHVFWMKRALNELCLKHTVTRGYRRFTSEKRTREWEGMERLLSEVETKEGRHLLDWSLNLVIEMHHVIEYSSVLMDQSRGQRSYGIAPCIRSLTFLTNRMELIFEAGVKQNMVHVPAKLMHLSKMALRTLRQLNSNISATTNTEAHTPRDQMPDSQKRAIYH